MDEPCGSCKAGKFVQWCPVWSVYLCHDCRIRWINIEIQKTVKSLISDIGEVTTNGSS